MENITDEEKISRIRKYVDLFSESILKRRDVIISEDDKNDIVGCCYMAINKKIFNELPTEDHMRYYIYYIVKKMMFSNG